MRGNDKKKKTPSQEGVKPQKAQRAEAAPFQKGMEFELLIEGMGAEGQGIGKAEGIIFFVKDAVIGDRVCVKVMKMKKSYGYARLLEIIEASPYRRKPRCPYARQCGGCQLQALDYGQQLKYKEDKVRNNLRRIGGFSLEERIWDPAIGMDVPYFYRNKAQFPVGRDKDGRIAIGFYAARSHQIIPNRKCFLGMEMDVIEQILDNVASYMEENGVSPYDEATGKGLVRHLLVRYGRATGEVLACIVANGKRLPHEERLAERLQPIKGLAGIVLNVNEENTNVILGRESRRIWGKGHIMDVIGDVKYQISPLSFYQVNPVQTEKLYQKVLEYAELTGNETVWDLYCGIGTISLFLAQKARQVYGVEVVEPAIEDAKRNANLNGIGNVEFFVGKAEEVLPGFYEKGKGAGEMLHPDVIVVDPPRKGCDGKCLETIARMAPERVVYVSCDSATLARDLKYLCEEGYEIKRAQVLDMFCQTVHVESICLLHRKDS